MGTTGDLARYIVETSADQIPEAIIHEGKRCLINFLSVALYSSRDPSLDILLDVFQQEGSGRHASVLGSGVRTSLQNAALANGYLGHLEDYDDTHFPTVIHPSSPTLPAALALGEQLSTSGLEVLAASVLGMEACCRIGMAVHPYHYDEGWHITGTCGVFGSVIAYNRSVDEETAAEMSQLFVEVVIAPSYDSHALELFSRKKNLRVIEIPQQSDSSSPLNVRSIQGGFLVQERDVFYLKAEDVEVVSRVEPGEKQMKDLLFSWTVCKHVKSNAIVLAQDEQTLGIGAGQMSRVDSVELSVRKANLSLAGSVMASDAFFPFPDSIEAAARAGVKAVIQPGGSIHDQEVVEAADRHRLAMVFTGIRHFRH